MAQLKEKVLRSLQDSKQLETTLQDFSKFGDNLLKNYSNPAFNKKEKAEILKSYMDLQNLGKSLYRYGILKENNYLADAKEEQENIENTVLKGGVSYNRYIWRSENGENTCDECRVLDGQTFDFYDEVPERPHPNCKCSVEIIEGEIESQNSQENNNKIPSKIPQPKTPVKQQWILPVAKGHSITSNYGYRLHPVYKTMKLHDGIDINATANTPVYSVADGTVSVAGWVSGYGNYIQIEHSDGLTSFYAHLNKIHVSRGTIVKQGQNIALSGNTGIGTGPHLHFGVKKDGKSEDPMKYLPNF